MASPREQRPRDDGAAAPSASPVFADRSEAGALLGAAVREALWPAGDPSVHSERGRAPAPGTTRDRSGVLPPAQADAPRVFALPRGGVPVAAGVARGLSGPPAGVMR